MLAWLIYANVLRTGADGEASHRLMRGILFYAANLWAARLTGPYRAWRAIGPRPSLADHGLTFA